MRTIHKLTMALAMAALLAPVAWAQKGTPADSGQGQKIRNQEQTQTRAQYKDEDGNGVCDQCKVQKKEQARKQTRTRAKKQTGDCSGNMAPQGGGSGCRQGQGNGNGNGRK